MTSTDPRHAIFPCASVNYDLISENHTAAHTRVCMRGLQTISRDMDHNSEMYNC